MGVRCPSRKTRLCLVTPAGIRCPGLAEAFIYPPITTPVPKVEPAFPSHQVRESTRTFSACPPRQRPRTLQKSFSDYSPSFICTRTPGSLHSKHPESAKLFLLSCPSPSCRSTRAPGGDCSRLSPLPEPSALQGGNSVLLGTQPGALHADIWSLFVE